MERLVHCQFAVHCLQIVQQICSTKAYILRHVNHDFKIFEEIILTTYTNDTCSKRKQVALSVSLFFKALLIFSLYDDVQREFGTVVIINYVSCGIVKHWGLWPYAYLYGDSDLMHAHFTITKFLCFINHKSYYIILFNSSCYYDTLFMTINNQLVL